MELAERSGDKGPAQVVLEFYAALRDSRIQDLLDLVAPNVACRPLVRPGLSVYSGHDGMVRFDRDMHAVHGRYQFEIDEITEHDGPEVTVEFRILSNPVASSRHCEAGVRSPCVVT